MAGGLLDFLNTPEARLGIGLLAAGGPTTDPSRVGLGQRLAGAMQSVNAQQDAEMKRQYLKSQMDENASQIAARTAAMQKDAQIQALIQARLAGGRGPGAVGGGGATPNGGGVEVGINPGMASMQQNQGQLPQGYAAGSGGNQSYPLSLNDLTLLGAAGSKNADLMFNMYKYATDGVKQEAGNYYKDPMTGQIRYLPKVDSGMTIGPDGQVSSLPGYATANANVKGQEAGSVASAKMPFDVLTDRARQVTQAQLDPVQAINQRTGDTDFVPRSVLAGMQSGTGAMGGSGGGIAVGGAMLPGTGGQSQGPNPYIAARNPIKQQSATALNDNWIKTSFNPVREAGSAATELQTNVQALRNIDFQSGWGGEAKANAAAVLQGLGMGTANSDMYAANAQKFQSVAMDRLMKKQIEQKGTATEGDAKRLNQTFVALKNTPGANQFILDLAEAQANQDRRRAEYYEQAMPLAQNEGDLTKVDRMWRKVQGSIWNDPILQKWSK